MVLDITPNTKFVYSLKRNEPLLFLCNLYAIFLYTYTIPLLQCGQVKFVKIFHQTLCNPCDDLQITYCLSFQI